LPTSSILSYPGQQQQQQLRVDVCVIRAAICIAAAAAAAGLGWKKKKRKLVPSSSSFVLTSCVHLYQLLLEASSSSH
jgi:epoxyqueuosine reductase QueG